MAVYFADTSVLAKRYVNETGTRWIRQLMRREAGNSIIIAELALVEMFSVLAHREQNNDITPTSANRRRQAFLYHAANDYEVIAVNSQIFIQSRDLVTTYRAEWLRSLDAIQLACAVTARNVLAQPLTFISADDRLLTAAAGEGFAVHDPRHFA